MNTTRVRPSWALFISVLIVAMFAAAISAQKFPTPVLWEDTAINPHDFTDEHYASNGVLSKAIVGRRTGTDFLSVFGPSSNPTHTGVRVIATLPAYGPYGEIFFWYPLGTLADNGFTGDKMGVIAREAAAGNPIYVFPQKVDNIAPGSMFLFNMRQAALMGPNESFYKETTGNPLGLRLIYTVAYTEKAFEKEFAEMMNFMLDKNGAAIDGLPVIRSIDDIQFLRKFDLLSIEKTSLWDDGTHIGAFALAPVMDDPTGGAIAPDAFLVMATIDGKPLPSEQMFATQFGCLRKYGRWCMK